MDNDDQNNGKTGDEGSFAELLDQNFVESRRFEPGQKVEAVVLKITKDWVFLDLGRKKEGHLDKKELADKDGNLTVQEGDTIPAYFLSAENNEFLFTTKVTGGAARRDHLEEAWRSGIPVEGFVEKEIKGGYEVKIAGSIRSFCPYSQMGLQRVESGAQYVGQHLSFKIAEYGENGRNIVLSNRAVLEEERQAQKEALKTSLQEGMRLKGTITSIRNFGAFVNVGSLEGLIPISEIAWGRVENIRDILTEGQEVEVTVMKLDWPNDRFSFSLKNALADPWDDIETKYTEGAVSMGKIARLTNFGAFVSLEDGVDGLIHISKLGSGKRINHPREVVTVGQVVEVKLEKVDKEARRLSLSLAGGDQPEEEKDRVENYRDHVKETPTAMGTLGDMLKAKLAGKPKR